jgi:hypothetical protein
MPCDGDCDVDAEHSGEEGGGQVGCELEERGGAVLAGMEPELAAAPAFGRRSAVPESADSGTARGKVQSDMTAPFVTGISPGRRTQCRR